MGLMTTNAPNVTSRLTRGTRHSIELVSERGRRMTTTTRARAEEERASARAFVGIGYSAMALVAMTLGNANTAHAREVRERQRTTTSTTTNGRATNGEAGKRRGRLGVSGVMDDLTLIRAEMRTKSTESIKGALLRLGGALEQLETKTQENWRLDDVWVLVAWNWCIRRGREKLHGAIESAKSWIDGARAKEPFDGSFLKWFAAPMRVVQALFVLSWAFDVACDLLDALSTEWDIPLSIRVGFDKGSYIMAIGIILIMFMQKYLPRALARMFPSMTGNDTSVSFVITRLASAVMVLATLMLTLSAFGIPAKVLFSFGGLGGLAFGLAAKDFISNLIGGLVLAVMRPFKVGEKIYLTAGGGRYRDSADQSVSNYVVDEIGWYQTKLIPLDGKVTTIPNGYFLGANVINSSRSETEFFAPSLRIAYPDVEGIEGMTKEIREYLQKSPVVSVAPKTPIVFAKKIADDHVLVQVESYIWDVNRGPNKPKKPQFVLGRQQLILDVVRICRKHCPNSPVLPMLLGTYSDAIL